MAVREISRREISHREDAKHQSAGGLIYSGNGKCLLGWCCFLIYHKWKVWITQKGWSVFIFLFYFFIFFLIFVHTWSSCKIKVWIFLAKRDRNQFNVTQQKAQHSVVNLKKKVRVKMGAIILSYIIFYWNDTRKV